MAAPSDSFLILIKFEKSHSQLVVHNGKGQNKGQVNWGGVRKTALKRYTKSRRGHPRKEEKGS